MDDVDARKRKETVIDLEDENGESEMTSLAEPSGYHKRRVNDLIRESLDDDETERIAFFCECGSPRCFETVWLTGAEYERGRLVDGWRVLAPGH